MLAHPNQPSSAPPDSYPLDGLVRTPLVTRCLRGLWP
jgi:hypothetical protein